MQLEDVLPEMRNGVVFEGRRKDSNDRWQKCEVSGEVFLRVCCETLHSASTVSLMMHFEFRRVRETFGLAEAVRRIDAGKTIGCESLGIKQWDKIVVSPSMNFGLHELTKADDYRVVDEEDKP